jgi:hypothetical protein
LRWPIASRHARTLPNKRLQLTSGRRDVLEAGTFLASKAQAWPARVAPTWAAEP